MKIIINSHGKLVNLQAKKSLCFWKNPDSLNERSPLEGKPPRYRPVQDLVAPHHLRGARFITWLLYSYIATQISTLIYLCQQKK